MSFRFILIVLYSRSYFGSKGFDLVVCVYPAMSSQGMFNPAFKKLRTTTAAKATSTGPVPPRVVPPPHLLRVPVTPPALLRMHAPDARITYSLHFRMLMCVPSYI